MSSPQPPVRVVICWAGIAGYLAACWRALSQMPAIDLLVVSTGNEASGISPFDLKLLEGVPVRLTQHPGARDAEEVAQLVLAHQPDVVVISGWLVPSFRRLAHDPRFSRVKFAMGMDTPWRGTWRQHMAKLALRRLLSRMSRVIVPGERAWQYGRRLGVPEKNLRRGLYGINFAQFASAWQDRSSLPAGWPRAFLYMGRYVDAKALDVLVEAYREYRSTVRDPWPLTGCGKGPLAHLLADQPGIRDVGFVQPSEQREVWAAHGAFILASRFDPWPLVLVEACAAGLPVLCTESCGSSVELVRSYYNGLTVGTGSASTLAQGMRWLHEHYDELSTMGKRSQTLAEPYAAEAWARRWHEMIIEMCAAS